MTITARALAALAITSALAAPAPAHAAPEVREAEAGSAIVGDIVIEAAWTRQPPPGARVGGGYATITNNGGEADVLTGGSAPFTNRFEVHEMSVTDGVMRMAELGDGLTIEPGETVELKPGGFHLMFIDMTEPPVAGSTVPITLRFERAGEVTLDLPVAAIGATSPDGSMGGGMDGMNHGAMGHGDTMDAETTN